MDPIEFDCLIPSLRGEWHALSKDRNAAMASWGRSLRASREAVIRCVMPLGKGAAIPREASLAANRFLAR